MRTRHQLPISIKVRWPVLGFRTTAALARCQPCSRLTTTDWLTWLSWHESGKTHCTKCVQHTSHSTCISAKSLDPLYDVGMYKHYLDNCRSPRSNPSEDTFLCWRDTWEKPHGQYHGMEDMTDYLDTCPSVQHNECKKMISEGYSDISCLPIL